MSVLDESKDIKGYLEVAISICMETVDFIKKKGLNAETSGDLSYFAGKIDAYTTILSKLNSTEKKSGVKTIHG